jgi:hypothetical protein
VKVEMVTIVAGPGGSHQPGDVVEVDEETGNAWIDGGFAKPAEGDAAAAAEVGDYAGMKVTDLRTELRDRGLEVSGTRPELVARLQEDDAAPAAPFDPTEPTAEAEEVPPST